MASFLFLLFLPLSSPARFCSSSRCNPRGKKRGTQPCLGKLVRKLGFWPSFLVQEPDLEPRNLPPLLEKPDLPCSALSFRRLLLIVGDFWAFFRIFPSMPPALPQIAAPALLAGLCK
ncbi:hypothetical protein SLEP1_g55926 [Rubroshorea leprosula]|uniref:Secreted protein n=1 Tax=Rubroshorea leprosula TaxID=152421 RepID=A0AAV5MHB7_9ROSI|nr:hypothetical protein SLEP1_g55926 [Rubroshorea leprosula]